jgi:flagellar hook-length control protein FliK
MMLPLSVANQITAQSSGQAQTPILPGQGEPDLADEQQAGYDLELAGLLLQLPPLTPAETLLPTATVSAGESTTVQATTSPEQTALLTALPLQHFSQQKDYQLNPLFGSADMALKNAEIGALTPTQTLAASSTVSAASIHMMQNMLNAAVSVPTAASSVQIVPAAAAAPMLADETLRLLQIQNAVPAAPISAALATLETVPQAVATLLEPAKTYLPAASGKSDFSQIQLSSGLVQQQPQQAALHSIPLSQAIQRSQLLNLRSGAESSQLSLPTGVSATQAVAQQMNYQWQSEPMPAEPVRFGQRLLALLSDKVDVQLGLGVHKAMIRLDPPSLGSIELAVQMDGEKLTVHLNSSNTQLKEAMQQGLEQLRASLQLRLGSDAQIELRMGPDTQSQQQREQQAQAQDEIAANIAGVELSEDADDVRTSIAGLVNQLV